MWIKNDIFARPMNIIKHLFILLPLAVAPGIGICFFIYFRDKFEKEPFRLLVKCFFLGFLSIIPAIIIELLFEALGINGNQGVFKTLVYAFLVVGVAEEGSKFFFLRIFAYKKDAFNEPFDGIVYAMMVSMGFATLENIEYVLINGLGTALLRMFTAIPLHAVCAIFMGFYLGKAKFSVNKTRNILLGLFFAIAIHGLYDFFLFQKNIPALSVFSFVTLGLAIGMSFIAINRLQKNSPFRGKAGQS